MIKSFIIQFKDLGFDKFIRNNFRTFNLKLKIDDFFVSNSGLKFIRIKDIFNIISGLAFKSDDYELEGIPLIRIGDIGGNFKNTKYLPEEYEKIYKDFLLKKFDLIVGLTGDGDFKIDLIDTDNKYLLNQRVGVLRVKNKREDVNILFYYYLLRCLNFIAVQFNYFSNGKTQLNISPFDLLNIKIPLISKQKQDEVVEKIIPIENNIKKLKNKIEKPQDIINEVFAEEFGFDVFLLNQFGKGMTAGTQNLPDKKLRIFQRNFSEFSRSDILRFSTRFHNNSTKNLMNFFNTIESIKVKDVVDYCEKGVQPKYNENGEIPVIKIINLKNNHIDFLETEKISRQYFNKLGNKNKLKLNDIIICATGKISLGKIDIYENKEDAITSLDNYILRLRNIYNPLFFTYFFRSIMGYFQIERDFTGTTNQIHLYWDQISNFRVPNIPLSHQNKIVENIKSRLDKQEEIEKEIEIERNKIDKIIELVVR